MEDRLIRGAVGAELSRRQFVQRAGVLGAGALIAGALPYAARMAMPARAEANVALQDGTLQAFYDTLIPGRPAGTTDLGHEIHPKAIAGVDPDPGAVEADALLLGQDPRLGFTVLAVPFLAELEALAVLQGGDFLDLPYEKREQGLPERTRLLQPDSRGLGGRGRRRLHRLLRGRHADQSHLRNRFRVPGDGAPRHRA